LFISRSTAPRVTAIRSGFICGWGAEPSFCLTPEARRIRTSIGGVFVVAKPDPQLAFHDNVPDDVIALGDIDGRLKDWFARMPDSVVLLRPDRFVASMCSPQCASEHVVQLAQKLARCDPRCASEHHAFARHHRRRSLT
jgi:3-(3-hydroxy-phenyl)propionate hydroxylase